MRVSVNSYSHCFLNQSNNCTFGEQRKGKTMQNKKQSLKSLVQAVQNATDSGLLIDLAEFADDIIISRFCNAVKMADMKLQSAERKGMTLEEIKDAVNSGKKVCCVTTAYDVIVDKLGQWLIVCSINDFTTGLTHQDGVTMNGKPRDFFIKDE